MRFTKIEGLGNDFVVLDERTRVSPRLAPNARIALCDRHRFVGADGVLSILAPSTASALARMHITNADGSEPEMCGNGLRCVSLFLVAAGAVKVGEEHVVDTDAGPRRAIVQKDGNVQVDMGPALFEVPGQIPSWFRASLSLGDSLEQSPYLATAVSMGNPHLVLEMEPDIEVAKSIGPRFERHPSFPSRTNVELARVRSDGSIDVVVWERGVGITEACGTGACGVAAVFARIGAVPYDSDITVRLPGGALQVRVPKDGGAVRMTGPAHIAYAGDIDDAALTRAAASPK